MKRFPDFSIYARAIPMLVRAPSIFVAPLLGGVVALVLSQVGGYLTAPVGGVGGGLFDFIANVFYSFAFGVAIIQADALERGLRANFDAAWEDARRKAGGIIVAAIGFWFIVMVAQYVGQVAGLEGMLLLELVAAFFLIYTIPAAAIGGLPGQFALGGSLRAVRANVLGAVVLAVFFVGVFVLLPPYVATIVAQHFALSHTLAVLVEILLEAIALGYLAFPFAKQYADVAYRI